MAILGKDSRYPGHSLYAVESQPCTTPHTQKSTPRLNQQPKVLPPEECSYCIAV